VNRELRRGAAAAITEVVLVLTDREPLSFAQFVRSVDWADQSLTDSEIQAAAHAWSIPVSSPWQTIQSREGWLRSVTAWPVAVE
jgi:hypothetical protein